MNKDTDRYILKSADFAKPILNHLRKLVHTACPHVEETIKWGFPHFEYKGIICSMAAFNQHCAFGFYKAAIMKDAEQLKLGSGNGMGSLGKIKELKDLPPDKILLKWIKEAVQLNVDRIKLPQKNLGERKSLAIPPDFKVALAKHKKSSDTFYNFSYSNKKEYIEWIDEAKAEATRIKRIETSIEWLTEGKIRMWKYIKK